MTARKIAISDSANVLLLPLVDRDNSIFITFEGRLSEDCGFRINDIIHIVQSGYEDDIVGIIRQDKEELFDIIVKRYHSTITD